MACCSQYAGYCVPNIISFDIWKIDLMYQWDLRENGLGNNSFHHNVSRIKTYSSSHVAQIMDFLDFLHKYCEENS